MDFNDAERQSSGGGEPMPAGTVAPVVISLRGIKTSKSDNRVQGLDLEFTVSAGPFKGRKAWKWAGFSGNGSDGHNKMVAITRAFIRGALESAYGVDPSDDSQAAMDARRLGDWDDLQGLEFVARFDVEKGEDYTDQRTGEHRKGKDKNTLVAVTPDDPDYQGFTPAKRKPALASAGGVSAPKGNSGGAYQRPNFAR
jgi:hypothetical protein